MLLQPCLIPARRFFIIATVLIWTLFIFQYHLGTLPRFARKQHATEAETFPKLLWYKLGPSGLSNRSREWTDTCIKANPDYLAKFFTDSEADAYVSTRFSSRPDIVQTYLGLTVPILKADIFRYLLLLDQGGIWSDLDVSCESVPIEDWIPCRYNQRANLVLGLEFDWGWREPMKRQFATWTIMAKPGSPHISMAVDDILKRLKAVMDTFKVPVENITLPMVGDVVDFTGPMGFTSSVLTSVQQSMNGNLSVESIRKLEQPRLVGDVLILPGYSFAAASNRYGDGEGIGTPLVTHHFAGTWKNDYGGKKPL